MPISFPNFKQNLRNPYGRKLLRESDGDTPVIDQPVRMVSCDTPEKAGYAGKPPVAQTTLDKARERLVEGFYPGIPGSLRDYLVAKLTPDAAERHINAANRASDEFGQLLESRLTLDNGSKRNLGVIPTGEIVDLYGRLLAYLIPFYKGKKEGDPIPPDKGSPERATFNLNMIASGWAAFFPIYPSLPQDDDLNRALDAAEHAWEKKLGAWHEFGATLLLGYEYRMCVKLGRPLEQNETPSQRAGKAFERICVNIRTRRIKGAFGFPEVPPPHRLWIWKKDLPEATQTLGLQP